MNMLSHRFGVHKKYGLQFLRGNSRVFKRNVGRKLGKHKAHDLAGAWKISIRSCASLKTLGYQGVTWSPWSRGFDQHIQVNIGPGSFKKSTTPIIELQLSSNPNSTANGFSREFLKITKSMSFFLLLKKKHQTPPTPKRKEWHLKSKYFT